MITIAATITIDEGGREPRRHRRLVRWRLRSRALRARAADDDQPSGSTASGRAHEFGAAVKRDAKLFGASVKEGAHRVGVAAKAVGHEISTAAKRGAAETRAAMKGEKGQTPGAKSADPAGAR